MAQYKVQVRPKHERAGLIKTLAETPKRTTEDWFVYESKPVTLPVIMLPLDVPIYRMANGRTQTDQLIHIASAKAPADFFSKNEESVAAQQVQHGILARLGRDGTDSIVPIIEELERTGQTEPLLITPEGIALNGNRRLASMRELYASGKHPRFAEIECAILPPLTPDQLDDVEDRLQMRPETKLPYTWTNEAIRIRKRVQVKGKDDVVAQLMNREKAYIRRAIEALSLADIYLSEWRKEPYNYALVSEGRQFFFDLPQRLKGKDGELREINMQIAWLLFDNRQSLGSRIYEFNKVLGDKIGDVISRLTERLQLEEASSESEPEADDLEIDFGPSASGQMYSSLRAAIADDQKRDDVVEELRVVCQSILDAGKASKEGKSALMAARDANTRLTEIDLTKADPGTYTGIDKQLEEVINRAGGLRAKLDEMAKAKAGTGPVA
ncbi:MAG: hypothetical protein ACK4TR_13780 [Phenylobacterium sp.]|uniref:hypothetical protein n=1 Tax=Phenylobacterium sp. TaxID=1871053 RepID=UPI00391B7C87